MAPVGGSIPPEWWPALHEAVAAGLEIVSGMHTRLATVAGLAEARQLTPKYDEFKRQGYFLQAVPPLTKTARVMSRL